MIKLFPYYFIHSLKKAICNARTFVKVKTKSRHSKRELSPLGNCTCAIGDVLMRDWGLTQTRVGTNSNAIGDKLKFIPIKNSDNPQWHGFNTWNTCLQS